MLECFRENLKVCFEPFLHFLAESIRIGLWLSEGQVCTVPVPWVSEALPDEKKHLPLAELCVALLMLGPKAKPSRRISEEESLEHDLTLGPSENGETCGSGERFRERLACEVDVAQDRCDCSLRLAVLTLRAIMLQKKTINLFPNLNQIAFRCNLTKLMCVMCCEQIEQWQHNNRTCNIQI